MYKSRGLRIPSKKPGHYKLFWVVEGTVKEETFKDRPIPFAMACHQADVMERTTHKIGQIDVVHCDTNAQNYKQLNINF